MADGNGDGLGRTGVHAFVKDPIACCAGNSPAIAPRGDYEIDQRNDGVCLCSCATNNSFVLTFDAYLQHLNEGRIALALRHG
ncbi:MAG: hypothetical protein ACKVS5_16500 [Parvularculaceae bacterium]